MPSLSWICQMILFKELLWSLMKTFTNHIRSWTKLAKENYSSWKQSLPNANTNWTTKQNFKKKLQPYIDKSQGFCVVLRATRRFFSAINFHLLGNGQKSHIKNKLQQSWRMMLLVNVEEFPVKIGIPVFQNSLSLSFKPYGLWFYV